MLALILVVGAPQVRGGAAESATPEEESALFISWQKLADWLYPLRTDTTSGGEARDAITLSLHLLEIPGMPDDFEPPPLQLTWVPGGNRFEIEASHAGKAYQIGRRDEALWLHAPAKNFAVSGKPDVPLFPRLSELRRPAELPQLTPPIPREIASGLPAVLHREFLGKRNIRGNEALGFQLSPAKSVREQFNLPDASLDYWFTAEEGLPARLVYRAPDTGTVAVEFSAVETGVRAGEVGRPPAESDAYRKEVALYHLVRMSENLLNPPDRSEIPVIENTGKVTLLAEAEGGRLESHSGLRVLFLSGSPEAIGRHATGHLNILDNTIEGTGHVFPAACGIALLHAARCTLAHNHIHDLSYSGISVGWIWGYMENPSFGHCIEKNHIHDVGARGGLSDMGAIYLLGFQPGTQIRHNYIHDVNRAAYGGYGLYPDEGSSGLTIEGNLVVRCASNCVHQHFGRQNIYLNNVFAYGDDGAFKIGRDQRGAPHDFPPQGTLLFRNAFLGRNAPMFLDILGTLRGPFSVVSDCNLFWDETDGDRLAFLHEKKLAPDENGVNRFVEEKLDFKDYHNPDREGHSRVADPGFTDPSNDDFGLPEDSPARALGIRPLELDDVGPRKTESGRNIASSLSA